MQGYLKTIIILILVAYSYVAIASYDTLNPAANGYDVVAYQKENVAKPGNTDNYSYYNGQVFLFESSGHKELFDKDPEHYIPAFGGYCAMGVSKGKKFPVDPEAFHVANGKTYLNLNKKVQKKWLSDIDKYIVKAENNWLNMKSVEPKYLNTN